MLKIKPITLQGHQIQLEPLNETHKNELYAAAQDMRIWEFTSAKAYGEKFNTWFEEALNGFKLKQQLPFAVRRLNDSKIIGSTRYYDINHEHHRLTIGYTWYMPDVWGSFVNPACKFHLLNFAFEELQINRVEFVTDSRNSHSRAAIKKLGAQEEGLLRHHMVVADGFIRDSVIFSIIKSDWSEIKLALLNRLEKID